MIAVNIQHPADIPYQFTTVWRVLLFGNSPAIRREQLERERIAQARRRTSQNLTPDELVTINPRNFEIRYSEIISVEITRRLFQSQLRFYVSKPSTAGQIISFTLSRKQIPEAQRLLELVLPPEAKGK